MKPVRLFAALLFMGVCWGVTIPMTKVAVSTGHQAMGLIFWQLVISVIVLGGICLVRGIKPVMNRQALGYYLSLGFLGTLLPNTFSYIAAAQLPAGVMAIIIATVPMFSLSLALGLRFERFSFVRMSGVFLGIIAIAILIGPSTSLPDPEKAVFVLLALLAPLCYGLEGHYVDKRVLQNIDPIMILLGASVIGIIISAPTALLTNSWVDLPNLWGTPEKALITSSLIHAFVYAGYIWLVGASGAVFASQVAYIVTISGVLFSAIFLKETYSGWVWASLMLMFCGLALVQPREKQVMTTNL